MTDTLHAAVKTTANARTSLADFIAEMKRRRQVFDADNANLIEGIKDGQAAVSKAENELRALALVAYAADPTNRSPAPGVNVQLKKHLDYEPAAALAWAKETKMALLPESVDLKAFEKIAKVTALPFVVITDEPSIALAADLTEALAEAA